MTEPRNDGVLDRSSVLSMHQVSQLLNVPATTIRSWERRYGVPVVSRSLGGHRRYTRAELALLTRMRDEIAGGRRAKDAAALVTAAHRASPAALVEALVTGAASLQPDVVTEVLDRARSSLGLEQTIDEVLLPGMRQIGDSWEAGACDVAQEHLATSTVRAWLTRAAGRPGTPPDSRPILLSCGPRDDHTLGLECLQALLTSRGWDCRMLGARVPALSLARAVRETDAVAVVVVAQLSAARRSAVESLWSAADFDAELFYAGGAFASRQARQGVPGQFLGESLADAAERITSTLRGAEPDQSRGPRGPVVDG